jgi:hypothetical protein
MGHAGAARRGAHRKQLVLSRTSSHNDRTVWDTRSGLRTQQTAALELTYRDRGVGFLVASIRL